MQNRDWILVLVCGEISKQKFWDGTDWSLYFTAAKGYESYSVAERASWDDIPESLKTHRVVVTPRKAYRKLLQARISEKYEPTPPEFMPQPMKR